MASLEGDSNGWLRVAAGQAVCYEYKKAGEHWVTNITHGDMHVTHSTRPTSTPLTSNPDMVAAAAYGVQCQVRRPGVAGPEAWVLRRRRCGCRVLVGCAVGWCHHCGTCLMHQLQRARGGR